MVPPKPAEEAPPEYEQLRRHLARPTLEHPAGRQRPAAPPPAPAAPAGDSSTRLSVMDWLLAIGNVVARRLRRVPRSPMVPLHPRE